MTPSAYAPCENWYDDVPTENIGFFSGDGEGRGWSLCGEEGEVREDRGHARDQYTMIGPEFDDDIMREAVNNIRGRWDSRSYCLVGVNCQDFADALRQEYRRLASRPRGGG